MSTIQFDVSRIVDDSLELHETIVEAVATKVQRPREMVNRWIADARAGYQFAPGTPAYLAAKAYSEAWELHAGP
jgi:hypothetical protein